MDKRKIKHKSNHPIGKRRNININPDIISEWKNAPFPDNYFDMVIFDPPHLIQKHEHKECSLAKEYGHLDAKTYKREIKEGVDKLFKILKPEGIFILKWCENCVKVEEIIKLIPYPPLFGSNTKSKGHTANFWIVFLKYNLNKQLLEKMF